MNKPTYQELKNQVAELTRQNEQLQLNVKSKDSFSTKYWNCLAGQSPDGYAYCQMIVENDNPVDFIYLEVNDTFEKLTGLKNITGRRATEIFPELIEQHSGLIQTYGSVAKTGTPSKIELFFKPLQSWLTVSVICPERGYFITIFDNISGRKQMEKRLEQSEEKFKELIKNSFDMIVLLDSNGIQRFVSESCEKILGYRSEELINLPVIEQMIHPDDRGTTLKGFQEIMNNTGIGGAQYRHRHKNGSWVYLEAFGSNQIDNPYINSVVLNVRDITERKNFEESLKISEVRLRELNATKDKFFSIIAHDLKNPFNSILGFSNLLVEQIHENDLEGLKEYALLIRDSSQRALNLLKNLLEWSFAQTGRMEFNPEHVELVILIQEVAELSNDSALQKSITISRKLPRIIPVLADKAMLSTILRNLISNAIKFTNPGGEIIISAKQNKEKWIISIADNGVGITIKTMDKLFRIEESSSTMGTNRETGTGLGLLLCKEFIEKHGGTLSVESEVGKGSEFYFTI